MKTKHILYFILVISLVALLIIGLLPHAKSLKIPDNGPHTGDYWVWTMPDFDCNDRDFPRSIKGAKIYRHIIKIEDRERRTWITYEDMFDGSIVEERKMEFEHRCTKTTESQAKRGLTK